ncbi:MAG: hypothetical protein WBL02_02345 [Methanomethylovorans sp.]|uniref:hypothetical protein n=1 Tax=Methanomethylovorans sp. TaxID=2758717 RepID=UPI000A59B0B3|nr:hypothetical protein [Methanomethylovorans sp.]
MILQQEDKDAIVAIVASRYFSEQRWRWINLKKDLQKVMKTFEEIKEQYNKYPYMSRDWYVENSATKGIHMCDTWEELSLLIEFLRDYAQYFDFMVKYEGRRKAFCIASHDGKLTYEQENAITVASRLGCNVIVFSVEVPNSIEFDMVQMGGET